MKTVVALVALVLMSQVLFATTALKCTFTYSSASQDQSETISDPQEGCCINFDFQAYKMVNRCYVGGTAYVGADCGGDSVHIKGDETYSGRHDIFQSIMFD
ncbi:hypothetical protein BGX28_002509 [Mortierella sp. GBA30]|nr:hypothetical protein BGX28_002509 [Mortierella sp. GBA30]